MLSNPIHFFIFLVELFWISLARQIQEDGGFAVQVIMQFSNVCFNSSSDARTIDSFSCQQGLQYLESSSQRRILLLPWHRRDGRQVMFFPTRSSGWWADSRCYGTFAPDRHAVAEEIDKCDECITVRTYCLMVSQIRRRMQRSDRKILKYLRKNELSALGILDGILVPEGHQFGRDENTSDR